MARTRSISSIETEISKVTSELQKRRRRSMNFLKSSLSFRKQKQSIEAKQIMDAFRKSGKSVQELMTFLDV